MTKMTTRLFGSYNIDQKLNKEEEEEKARVAMYVLCMQLIFMFTPKQKAT